MPAIGSVLGSVASGLFGKSSASDQFNRNKELMKLQHDYQVQDYQHRYQWAADDMEKAGLNRILAATQGIGGSINGVSLGNVAMAPTPDFSGLGQSLTSASQIKSNKEIAKMANDVALGELDLKKLDINSAVQKRENDIKIENSKMDLEKWKAEESIKLQKVMQDAQIQNMVDRLKADIEHMERQDMNGAAMAAAAMSQANASGLMAAVQEKLGISKEQLNEAQMAYMAIQSENADESLKWNKWLNDHPYTRGTVGFLGSLFDTAGLAIKSRYIGKSVYDMVD